MSDSDSLYDLQRFITNPHILLLRLFFEAFNLGADVQTVTLLTEFKRSLEKFYKTRTIIVLRYMLDLVGVAPERTHIQEFSADDLTQCRVDLAYPSLVVEVCRNLGENDFKTFRHKMCDRYLKCAGNDMSREDLFTKLHQLDYFEDSNLRPKTIAELKSSQRNDLAGYVEDFYKNNRRFQYFFKYRRFLNRDTQDSGGRDRSDTETGAFRHNEHLREDEATPPSRSDPSGPGVDSRLLDSNEGSTTYHTFQEGGPRPLNVDGPQTPHQVTSTVSTQGTKTVHPITTTPSGRGKTVRDRNKSEGEMVLNLWLCLPVVGCILCSLLSFLCGVGTVVLAIVTSVQTSAMTTTVYGTGGETVVIAEFNDPVALSLTNSTIAECLIDPDSDFSHHHQLYTVSGSLPRRSRTVMNSSDIDNRTEPDCMEPLGPDNLYLLQDSNITFEVWLESIDKQPGQHGTLLIFDNNKAYVQYISPEDCPQHSGAAVEHNLNIGDDGFIRTSVPFTAKRNGYHYIIAKTPPNVRLRYEYTILQFYLSPEDFSQTSCPFSNDAGTSCNLGGVSQTPVYLVDAIQPNIADEPVSTHVCLTTLWSGGAIGSVAVLGALCVVCLFLVCSIIVYNCSDCGRKRKYDVTDV